MSAQVDVPARLAGRVPPEVVAVVRGVVDSAAARGLPVEPLVQKALEGGAKGVPAERVIAAVRALERALLVLTPEQREVLVLKHVEGLPYEEIAQLTGATVASLKMRMHRAYDRLRDELEEHR